VNLKLIAFSIGILFFVELFLDFRVGGDSFSELFINFIDYQF
jgi:hypothetical protein